MEINQTKIDKIKEEANKIMGEDNLNIPEQFFKKNLKKISLEDLYTTYSKVYPNINGDTNRLQIMANKHWEDEASKKMKHKSVQIYRLTKDDRKVEGFDIEKLIKTHNDVIKLCLYVEQLRLYEKIKKIEEKVNTITDVDVDVETEIELEKFFSKRKRKSIF